MDPRRWREVRALFDELIELPPADVSARLATIGEANPALRDSVVALLEADRQADHRLGGVDAALLPAPDSSLSASLPDPFGLVGRTLAHFQVVAPLGSGGMGIVYRAEDMRLKRTVALKVPRPEYRLDDSARQRFLHEARTAAGLDHPNLCSIHEVGESEEGLPFLTMPLYPGETLKARLAREGPLPVDEVVEIAGKVAQGLAAAHDAGIVHRDVKPGNVMLLPNGAVKVLDFGLAKVQDFTITGSRMQLGTVMYMAPEQIRGAAVDERTDLWALGVVLYEMVTGRRPFEGEHGVAVAHAVVHEEPIRPSALRRDIPPSLEDLLFALLRKDPAGRPRTARQVASELDTLRRDHRLPARRSVRQRWAAATGWRRSRMGRVARATLITAGTTVAVAIALATRPQRLGTPTDPTEASIAVLPFVNLSTDPQQDYLGDGITDELTFLLATEGGMRVAARTSSYFFKGRNTDVREVGTALGVAAVLRGTVRGDGQRVRITARLLDASSGGQLWAESYERDLKDVLAIQEEIRRAVRATLRPPVTRPIASRPPPTRSPEAHELYLKGRHFWNQRTEEALVRATDYFRQAVALDPEYAEAYSGLADVEIAPRDGRPADRFARAKAAASRALALDSTLVETHLSTAWVKMWYDRDWAGAERHLQRALELNPNHIWAHAWYAAYLAATQRVEESLWAIQRAHELDPLSHAHTTYVGAHYLWLHRDTEAVIYFRKALEMKPDFFMAHWGLGRAYLVQGRYREALAEFQYDGGDFTGFHKAGLLGYAHALAGHKAEASRILGELQNKVRQGDYVPAIDPAIIHLGLGQRDAALTWLERLEEEHGARTFLVDPIFDPIRSEPRFQELLQRLGQVKPPS